MHQNDPQEGSYWGYMPLSHDAVHRQYAAGDDPSEELAAFVAAAHDADIEVWLDVVFNHTTEIDATGPTYILRGLDDAAFYRLRPDGSYIETTGCGNDLDVTSPAAQDLVRVGRSSTSPTSASTGSGSTWPSCSPTTSASSRSSSRGRRRAASS